MKANETDKTMRTYYIIQHKRRNSLTTRTIRAKSETDALLIYLQTSPPELIDELLGVYITDSQPSFWLIDDLTNLAKKFKEFNKNLEDLKAQGNM